MDDDCVNANISSANTIRTWLMRRQYCGRLLSDLPLYPFKYYDIVNGNRMMEYGPQPNRNIACPVRFACTIYLDVCVYLEGYAHTSSSGFIDNFTNIRRAYHFWKFLTFPGISNTSTIQTEHGPPAHSLYLRPNEMNWRKGEGRMEEMKQCEKRRQANG